MDATVTKPIPETRVELMWDNGPLRRFCAVAFSAYIPYNGLTVTGYAGPYVCAHCGKDCSGVYYVHGHKWVCGTCRPILLQGGVPAALGGSQVDTKVEVPADVDGQNEQLTEENKGGKEEGKE